jgi:hypothetical protein
MPRLKPKLGKIEARGIDMVQGIAKLMPFCRRRFLKPMLICHRFCTAKEREKETVMLGGSRSSGAYDYLGWKVKQSGFDPFMPTWTLGAEHSRD